MPRFSFRLQSFLSVKEQLEELRKNEYGAAIRKLEEEKEKLRILETEVEENVRLFKISLTRAINPVDIKRYNNRIEFLKKMIIEQKKRIKKAEDFVEERRLALIEAMKERKALETVRARAYEEYLREESLREQLVTDGIVSYKYAEKSD